MIKTSVHEKLDISIFKIQDPINVEDVIEAMKRCTGLPGWHNAQNIVIDQRDNQGIIALADYDKVLMHFLSHGLKKSVKHAILVSSHTMSAMAKEWQNLVSDYETNFRIFFDLSEAANWLGIDEESLYSALD